MKLVIIDYGLCNLKSVYNACQHMGIKATVTHNPSDLSQADSVILPGVGAFEDGMKGLREKGFIEPIHRFVETGKPFLGICLGMQLLMSKSYEFGEHQGLDLIKGEVVPFVQYLKADRTQYKVPHIGWSGLLPREGNSWNNTLLNGLEPGTEMYFVHSFFVRPRDPQYILAKTQYGDVDFCSVIRRDNVMGCQFHPEKSAAFGLKIIDNFIHQIR